MRNISWRFHKYLRKLSSLVLFCGLAGCIESSERLLDVRGGVRDTYFEGRFEFTNKQGVKKEVQIYLKENRYIVEIEPGKLILSSIHSFKDDIMIVQQWTPERSKNPLSYTYNLVRKNAEGFDLGGDALCSSSCEAATSSELLRKLEDQSQGFAASPSKRITFRRM